MKEDAIAGRVVFHWECCHKCKHHKGDRGCEFPTEVSEETVTLKFKDAIGYVYCNDFEKKEE